MGTRTATKRYEKLLWTGGIALVLFYLALVLDGNLSQTRGGDGPSYLLLARSLAEGFSYSDINIPGAPAHTQYPPLFPLLLSPVYFFFGYNFLLIKVLLAVLAVASLFLIRSFFSNCGGALYGTVISVLTGTNFFFLFYTNEIQTEIPYLFLSFLALAYARKYLQLNEAKAYQILFVLPLMLALSYMMRMIGVTLAVAAFFALLLARGKEEGSFPGIGRTLLFALAASVPFVLWTARNSLYGHEAATYQSIFVQTDYYSFDSGQAGITALFDRFFLNSGYYFHGFYEMLVAFRAGSDAVLWAGAFIVFLLLMAGFVRELFSKREMKDLYFLFYLGLLTVWPVYGKGDAHRYLVPMLPLMYHYVFAGAAFLWDKAIRFPVKAAAGRAALFTALAVFLGVMNLAEMRFRSALAYAWDFDGVSGVIEGRLLSEVRVPSIGGLASETVKRKMPCFYNYLVAADSMRGAMADGGVLMTRKPEIVYLLLDRPVVRFPYTSDAGAMESFIREKGVSHVLLDGCYPETESYARKFVDSKPGSFKALVSDGQGTVGYRLQ